MPAPVIINIDGIDYQSSMQDKLTIKSVVGQTVADCDCTIYDKTCSLTIPEGKEIIITRGDTGERIFGGLTSMVTDWTEGVSRYFQIKGQSFTILLDRIIFYNFYQPGYSDKWILNDLFTSRVVGANGQMGAASEINAVDHVATGSPALSSLVFHYSYAREAVELLAAYVGYNYYVDFYKKLHYYYKESETAPFGLSSSPDGSTTIRYRNLKRKRDATRIINNYLVYGSTATSLPQESIASNDGVKKIINVAFKGSAVVLQAPPGESMIGVWRNTGTDVTPVWTAQTVGLVNTDDPGSVNCLYDPTALTLIFTSAPPNLTNSIKVRYVFAYSAGMPKYLESSYQKYGRLFSSKLIASDANSAASMFTLTNNLAEQFGYALQVLTCDVDDGAFPAGNTLRFKAGQWVRIVNAVLGIDESYVIHSITTKILGGELKSYSLELRSYTLE